MSRVQLQQQLLGALHLPRLLQHALVRRYLLDRKPRAHALQLQRKCSDLLGGIGLATGGGGGGRYARALAGGGGGSLAKLRAKG